MMQGDAAMKWKALIEQAQAALNKAEGLVSEDMTEEAKAEFDRLMAEAAALQERAQKLRQVEEQDARLKAEADGAPSGDKLLDTVYVKRFGSEDAMKQAVMADLLGRDYRQKIADQNAAFAKYLRGGDTALDREEVRLLKTQIFPWPDIEEMIVKAGLSVAEVKTTMVEAQGTLGGYAVPPNVQEAIATRLAGFTVVRGNGATVVNLVQGTGVDVPVYTGGNDRYVGALRGQWGAETQTPSEQNATLGMTTVVANVYTYKVSFSQSLVEDASNLVELVQADIATTLAIDEDDAFLVGDGVGKPLGILPGWTNGLGLSSVASGSASALTANGLKALRRGIASQYRQNAIWIANNDTFLAIEKLTDGAGAYLFGDMADGGKLMGNLYRESEAMPDVAASAYPIIFGDLSGYYIVQKAGLTIMRFQDSNTGINKVEYHVRRRVGGRVVKPWQFAVQVVSAS